MREAPGGRLGLSDRKREAGEAGGARRGRTRPQARSTVFLGHRSQGHEAQWPGHSLLYQAGTAGAGPRACEGSQARLSVTVESESQHFSSTDWHCGRNLLSTYYGEFHKLLDMREIWWGRAGKAECGRRH